MWRDTKKIGYSMMRHTTGIGIKGRWSDYPVLQETMSLFKISVSLILIALSTHCAANELDGFGYSCKDISLVNNVLYSSCEGTDGSYISTSINLDQCVVNTNGNLSCSANGNYSSTCSNCYLSGKTLVCTCNNYNHVGQSASVNLNSCLSNSNGQLTC